MLTRKQHELLVYIDRHLKQTGFSPSFEEMKEALQLKSKSGIHRLISALEERGFIGRRHHRARALEVLRLPEDNTTRVAEPVAEAAASNFSPNVIRGDFSPRIAGVRAANEVAA
ncbi:MAG TPA: repressor LexA, partial [Acetobacteraceae bacterium]